MASKIRLTAQRRDNLDHTYSAPSNISCTSLCIFFLTQVATVATIKRMKSIGIKLLKNKLSSYLELVKKGERILVTDRDEVIAEICRPNLGRAISRSPLEEFLDEGALSGALTLPASSAPFPRSIEDLLPATSSEIDSLSLLNATRKERY